MLFLGIAFAAVIVLAMPMDWVVWTILLGIYVIAVLGLHILTGLCGQFSMGHAAFMAVGAYAAAYLGGVLGWPAWGTFLIAGLAAAAVGMIFGLPALRIKGFYLVMTTIAAQFVIIWYFREAGWSGGVYGLSVPSLAIGGQALSYIQFWWLTLAIIVPMLYLAKNIQRTSWGRKFVAVRDNDLAAEVMGINLFRTKIVAFFIGCFFAGIGGWLWAHFMGHITPLQFDFHLSLVFLSIIIVGGVGSTAGVVLGAVVLRLVEKLVDNVSSALQGAFPDVFGVQVFPALSLIFFAAVVLFFIRWEPRGLYHKLQRFKTYYRLHPFSY